MLLRGFKISVLGAVVLLGSQQAVAAPFFPGIPVVCGNCAEGPHNAAQAIMGGIRVQTEALLAAENLALKAKAKIDLDKDLALLKVERGIENQRAHDPKISKPDSGCTNFKSSSLRSSISSGASGEVKEAIKKINESNNNIAAHLSETEPKREYLVKRVIDNLHSTGDEEKVSSADVILSEPFSMEKLLERLKEIAFLSNPLPIETPSVEALEHIAKNGSTGDQDAMARVLVANDRIARSQAVLADEERREAQVYDAGDKFLGAYLKEIKRHATSEQKKLLKGKLSANQIDEFLATYRVRSAKWVSGASTASAVKAAREQTLIQAEILNQLWEIKGLLRTMKKMNAWSDAQNTVQKGVTTK